MKGSLSFAVSTALITTNSKKAAKEKNYKRFILREETPSGIKGCFLLVAVIGIEKTSKGSAYTTLALGEDPLLQEAYSEGIGTYTDEDGTAVLTIPKENLEKYNSLANNDIVAMAYDFGDSKHFLLKRHVRKLVVTD